MIKSFDEPRIQRFFAGKFFAENFEGANWFQRDKERLTRCLTLLDCAATLGDLAGLPSYRLRRVTVLGTHCIQVNPQSIVVFSWTSEGGPSGVRPAALSSGEA